MKRGVRASRFQLSDESEESRPVFRKLCFLNPFQVNASCVGFSGFGCGAKLGQPVQQSHVLAGISSSGPCASQCELEDSKRLAVVRQWVVLAESLRDHSEVLQSVPHLHSDSLNFLFEDRSASTLLRHLNAWKRWSEFCKSLKLDPACPSVAILLDFAQALSAGAALDRGSHRASRAKGVLQSLKFAAAKLGLSKLQSSMDGQAVQSWLSSGKWLQTSPREAIPLPLFVIANLESALSSASEDAWLLGCILLMVWGGLRWSDAQRLQFSSLVIEQDVIRGWCWRTKTSAFGMPFGVWTSGVVSGARWGCHFGALLTEAQQAHPGRDFLVARQQKPLGYAAMLAQFRRCLCLFGGLDPSQAGRFTLHSCKATSLCWAAQLGLSVDLRAAQGHHRLPNQCVKKYGRDDVWPQLRCQRKILQAVAGGWCPATPLNRGLATIEEDSLLLQRLCRSEQLTESESDDELEPPSASGAEEIGSSDVEIASSDEEFGADDGGASVHDGPWIVNSRTGWCHKAVVTARGGLAGEGGVLYGLGCRPTVHLADWYQLRLTDPEIEGFQPCGHTGCFCQSTGFGDLS